MPPPTQLLLTPADVVQFYPQLDGQPALHFLISAADAFVRKETGREYLLQASGSWVVPGSGFNKICLPEYPVTPNTLTITADGETTAVDTSEYFLSEKKHIVFHRTGSWCARFYTIVATAGFATVPRDLKFLTLAVLGDMRKQLSDQADLKRLESRDHKEEWFDRKGLSFIAENLLHNYRRV